jgi:hypothetical protein
LTYVCNALPWLPGGVMLNLLVFDDEGESIQRCAQNNYQKSRKVIEAQTVGKNLVF